MKVPNSDRAVIGDKLERYCLNEEHQRGKRKALLFRRKLGITKENKQILERALLKAVKEQDAVIYKQDRYGTHYDIKFAISTEVGSSLVLSCWIILHNESNPRLTNTYPVTK